MQSKRLAAFALFLLLAAGIGFLGKTGRDAKTAGASSNHSVPEKAATAESSVADPTHSPTVVPRPAAAIPARRGARRVPTTADAVSVNGRPIASIALAPDFLEGLVDAAGQRATFRLPDGRVAEGAVQMQTRDADGVLVVQGLLTAPEPGSYFFQRQTVPGVAGSLVGVVRFDRSEIAFRVDPTGPGGAPQLVAHRLDQVVCLNLETPDLDRVAAELGPEEAPQTHPINIPIPTYQNGVVPLQSLPGAIAVIYLDFDGEKGPFTGWPSVTTDAAPSGASNAQIKDVWQRVAEDYTGFTINVTTDRRAFDNAPPGRRQHCILTPTTLAAPGSGGVSFVGSFNNSGDTVNWSFYSTGKTAAEVAAHECGHALGLSHDGQNPPGGSHVEYYGGQGTGEVGWAPIMGVGYYQNFVQWSKGEYTSASNTEDDLAIITNNNNDVDFRTDDYGATLATAGYLEILPDDTVSNEGILEQRADVDAFRFTTTGGAVSLTASVVAAGPDVDLLAEIYDSSDALIASDNVDTVLSATVAATLPAGEYTLRISGVGRGDPLVSGYSDYACNGAYLISGTVAGGVKADRFTIAENSANGTAIGTVTTRQNHDANPLTFSIASGNTGGAFAIDASTGALTVAASSVLNYEALSTRWDDPATIEIFVNIVDTVNSALNETVRVVVGVSDVNEAPVVAGGAMTILEHVPVGTSIFKVVASDPDRFDFTTFSIVSGNPGNAFAIDAQTGQITVAADLEATTQSLYTLTVRVADHRTPVQTSDAAIAITVIDVPAGYSPGTIRRTYFDTITGSTVAALTSHAKFPNNPDSEVLLTTFEGGAHGFSYGSTMRGYLIPPTTGVYSFWIASDDASALLISTDASSSNATSVATVASTTSLYQWTKFPTTQHSANITLTAGTPYYIEARHKQNVLVNHVEVAWTGPGIPQQVIPGLYLAPFYQNYAPKIPAATMSVRENVFSGATVGTVAVTDVNAQDTHVAFSIIGGTGSAFFGIDANTGRIFVTDGSSFNAGATPSFSLVVQTFDNGTPALSGSGTITVNVIPTATINLTGIAQQIWSGISGATVALLTADSRYPNRPSIERTLTSFDTGSDYATDYGSRIRAYVVPPTTGVYTFYLASDDEAQFRLSTDTDPANATLIASVATSTARNTWGSFASQTSAPVPLLAGRRYFIEALHKNASGGNFVQVAWTGPGIASQTILPGSALQPFNINAAPVWNGEPLAFTIASLPVNGTTVGSVTANDPNGDGVLFAIVAGNPVGNAFAINSQTGAITVNNGAALSAGQTVNLQVAVQDDGHGGAYPIASATTTVAITVQGTPIEQWRWSHFGADAVNPLISGELADPDHDGLCNLLEYALALDPLGPSESTVRVDLETIGVSQFLRLTASKNPAATDVTFSVEVTADLSAPAPWDASGTTIETSTSTTLQVRDNSPITPSGQRSIRLKVAHP